MIQASNTIHRPASGSSVTLGKTRRMVSLDSGDYAFGLAAEMMLGVRDAGQVERLDNASAENAVSRENNYIRQVRCVDGDIPAIDLQTMMGMKSGSSRKPLVLARRSRPESSKDGSELIGLFVDSTSRPQNVALADWHELPDWVRAGMQIPSEAIAIQRDRSSNLDVRLILDPPRFGGAPFRMAPADSQPKVDVVEETTPSATESKASGRGLLVFAPAESSRSQIRVALAIPMSFVVGVDLITPRIKLPTLDPHLDGIVVWNDRPVPVLRLGDALGLPADELQAGEIRRTAGDDHLDATRLIVFRTPQNRLIGCMAHAQMRSLRTPRTVALQEDCGIESTYLLGAFVTDEGPLAVPNLDRLLHCDRWIGN